jgi:hypothetical protein
MVGDAVHIAGQAPRVQWRRNPNETKRTIDEAKAIARQYGVLIPDDVEFFEDEDGDLRGSWASFAAGEGETANGPTVAEQPDGYVYLADHYNDSGKIPFKVHRDVLTSDEAIVAVLTHETDEFASLREVMMADPHRRMNATDYGLQVASEQPGNFHDQAWDAADRAVEAMRRVIR